MEINEFEYESIFIESSENLGVVFDSYKKLGADTEAFLDKIEDAVNDLNKKADEAKINLKGDISSYKSALGCKKEAEPIDIRKVKSLKAQIKGFRFKLDTMLSRLARIKDKVAYGGNYLRAIIKRPKVYGHDMNDEKYTKTNNNIREVNRAIDWVEKAMIDLFNLVDQDLNILTIVDKIYASNKIFEGSEELPGGCYIGETDADIAQMLPGSADKVDEAGNYMYNSLDKKTGTAPNYLKGNHDMARYGEDDPAEVVEPKDLEDYRHKDIDDSDDIPRSSRSKAKPVIDDDDEDDTPVTKSSNNAPVNYYYYTYQNSLNKNTDSFNKYKTDDHSTGKQINSNNGKIPEQGDFDKYKKDDEDEEKEYKTIGTEEAVEVTAESDHNESANPWELNIFPEAITEATVTEDVGDADDDKPQADHPVRDAMIDVDRAMQSKFQDVRKTGQAVSHLYRTATRPVRRVKEFLNNQIAKWKDADETEIKERLADPNARKNIFHAIKVAIDNGAYLKAGILLNPVILGLHLLKKGWGKHSEERIKNEMILELQQEMNIIDEKIKDADYNHDNKAKYQLMRFKTEVQKKLWRVAGANTGSLLAINKHKTPGVSKFL